jgi:hypothetical protein
VAARACPALDDAARHADLRDALIGMGLPPGEATARLSAWVESATAVQSHLTVTI